MENEQENITNKMTSPQQILSTVNQVKLEPYEEFFDPQYSINQDQSSHTDAIKYKWTGGVTSEMIGQGFNHNQPHPFDSMYENNDSNQIPFHYCENPSPQQQQQQQNNSIGMDQFSFSQHRNSLPMIHNTDMFSPASNTLTAAQMQTIPAPMVPPYNRRYTEGSIPASTTTSSNSSSSTRKTRKQRISSVSSSSKEDDDEESKRKHFLERNRQAALKCRQRKKQWLANLQHRVEYLSTDNEQLQSQATMLREEVINLKTLLLAHKDCAVAQRAGVTVGMIQNATGGAGVYDNGHSGGTGSASNSQQDQRMQQQQQQPQV
ncbi:basic-leucine zipper transcription factor [Mucor lusitanicus]